MLDIGMKVVLLEKLSDGTLHQIEERTWSSHMVNSLANINFIVVGNQEYETVEGRLNLDLERLEILVVPMKYAE